MLAKRIRTRIFGAVEEDADKENVRRSTSRKIVFISILFILATALMAYSVTIGSTTITPLQVYQTLINQIIPDLFDIPWKTEQIILRVYAPRVLMATFTGATLAIGGCIVQTIMKNPLATPYTLGVSSSAAFGASLSIILGLTAFAGTLGTIVNAFLFSLVPAGTILIASMRRNMMPTTMVLVGIAISYVFSAATTIMQYFGEANAVIDAMFWAVGDLNRASLWQIPFIIGMFLATFIGFMLLVKDINIMRMGDDTASSLGVNVKMIRLISVLLACLSTAVMVSFSGAIGFICLLAPHISRIFIGSDLKFLVPASALMGALLLSTADIVAKDLINPIMLPVGAITALIGGPILIYLLLRKKESLTI